MATCQACGQPASVDASFCSTCGRPLGRAEPGAPRARKVVTVVFADVSGFTSLGERLDPESLQQLMARYFAEMQRVIERHGGTIEKFIGDAVVALFGVPRLHEDDALRAARAALEMRDALATLNDQLAERWDVRLVTHTGVNTGEVAVGETREREPVTYGDAVNVAQRLESVAAPGEILVGPLTERMLRGIARLEPVARLELKGRTEPVAAWRLLALAADDGDHPGAQPLRRLVGRAAELGALRDAFTDVVLTARPATVTLVGPAGIGKSRLARELRAEIAPEAAVALGRCVPYGEGMTYRPLADIVRGLAGRADEEAIAAVAGGGDEGLRIAARIARLVGASPGPVAPEEGHWAVRRLLEIVAGRRPLAVVVDDLHWAEPTLLDLVDHVIAHAAPVPLLFVCLARPELFDRHPDWRGFTGRGWIVPVGPLSDADAAALLAQLTEREATAADHERVLAAAEGNPFFLEQMAAMLEEPGEAPAGAPPTIQALLAARIDALPPAERAVVDAASVEGRTFHRGAVAELLSDRPPTPLDESLEALVRRQLIRPSRAEIAGEHGYRFAHVLVRDAAYGLLAKTTRAQLHERFAAWVEQRTDRHGELVGYHLEQAHRCHAELRPTADAERRPLATAAARRLRAAGQAALDRGDLPAGVNLLERTAALLPDAERGGVVPELGLALVALGRLSEADALLHGAPERAAARGDAVAAAHARAARFFARVQVDSAAAAQDVDRSFDAMRATFIAAGDDLGLSRLWRARALVHWLAGRSAAAEAAWMRGAEHASAAGDEHGRADALAWVASALALGPTPVAEAIPRCEAIVEQLHADRHNAALSMRPLGHLHAMAGRFDAAFELLAQSSATLADLGVSMHSATAHDEAFVALLAGDPSGAEAALRLGYEQLEAMGERALLATTAAMLARALAAQGRDDEAWSFADRAEAAAAADDRHAHMHCLAVRAELLARRGAPAEADRVSRQAVRVAEETDWVVDRGDALMARAAVLLAAGESNVAILTVRRALELYEGKGNAVSAERARALARVAA